MGKGKSTGKRILSIVGFGLGFMNPAWFLGAGATAVWTAGFMGASLGSAIWSSTHKPKGLGGSSLGYNFDVIQNIISDDAVIPIIYGTRKWGGYQTWHEISDDKQHLTKDIVLCEGEIEGIYDVRANDMYIACDGNNPYNGELMENKLIHISPYKNRTATIEIDGVKEYGKFFGIPIVDGDSIRNIFSSNIILAKGGDNGGHHNPFQDIPTHEDGEEIYRYVGYKIVVKDGGTHTTTHHYGGRHERVEKYEEENVDTYYLNEGAFFERWSARAGRYIVDTRMAEQAYDRANKTTIGDLCNFLNSKGFQASTYYPNESINRLPKKLVIDGTFGVYVSSINGILTNDNKTKIVHDCSCDVHCGRADGSNTPDNYDTVGGYKNIAWVRTHLKASKELASANPNITCIVKGLKIEDTRTGERKYSENPSMIVRDYLLNTRYGLGFWVTKDMIDEDSFKECADYCDGLVTFNVEGHQVTTHRYTTNIVLASKQTHIDNLKLLLETFGGFLVYDGKKIGLRMEKKDGISYVFDESNIIADNGKSTVSWNTRSLKDTPNQFNIKYFPSSNGFVGQVVQANDKGDQETRKQIITKQIELAGVTNQSQALRLAKLFMAKNKLCPLLVSFDTGTMAMHLQAGDIVALNYKELDHFPIRILSITESNGRYQIQGEQYNDSIYDDRLASQITFTNHCNIPNALSDIVPDVIDVQTSQECYLQSDGTLCSTLTVTWQRPDYQFWDKAVIDVAFDDGKSQFSTVGSAENDIFVIPNVIVGKKYKLRIRTQNTVGRLSNGVIIGGILINNKNMPPNDIQNLVVAQYGDLFQVQFDMPTDKDYKYTEIRYGGNNWDSANVLGLIVGNRGTLPSGNIVKGTNVFRAKAIDNVGNYSVHDCEYICDVWDLTKYKNIIFERDEVQENPTLLNAVKTENTEIVNNYSVCFGDFPTTTFEKFPLKEFPKFKGTIEVQSEVIDTYKVGETGITYDFIIDYFARNTTFSSFPSRTLGNYPSDTFMHITDSYNKTILIRFSNDNVKWTEYKTFMRGNYSFRYVQFKLILNYTNSNNRMVVKSLKQYYDVADITINKQVSVPLGGVDITYDFYEKPKEVNLTVVNGMGKVFADVSNITNKGLHISCYNNNGNNVIGNVLLTIKGY